MRIKKLIKATIIIITTLAFSQVSANCKNEIEGNKNEETAMEKILFVNGSPNRNGNTADLAKEMLEGRQYETLSQRLSY